MQLTRREELFCQYYTTNGNATKSAVLAGYSEKSARSIGSRLLSRKEISEEIKLINDKIKNDLIADSEEIKVLLSEFARGNIEEEVIVVDTDSGKGTSKAKKIKKKVSGKDRIRALELLAKMNLLFTDTTATNNNNIVIIKGEDGIAE